MSEIAAHSESNEGNQDDNRDGRLAFSIFESIMSAPGGTVDRASFLRCELREYCSDRQVKVASQFRPAVADVPSDVIDKLADRAIVSHTKKAAASSVKQAIPGIDLLQLNLTPKDSQVLFHAVIMSQKLAYLYGMPDFLDNGIANEETYKQVAVLVYTMFGVDSATKALDWISGRFAQVVRRRLPRLPLTKMRVYPFVKRSLRWVGIPVTKTKFAAAIAIAIVVGVKAASVGATTLTFRNRARKLRNHLRELEFAKPPARI